MRIPFFALAPIAAVLSLAGSHTGLAQGSTYKVVAFTGQSAPGGGTFYHFQTPSIGADGTIAFVGEDDRGEGLVTAVYSSEKGTLSRIISKEDAVPGEPDAVFEDFGPVSVSKGGLVGFNAGVDIDESYVRGIWSEALGGVSGGGSGTPDGFSLDSLGSVAFRSGAVSAKSLIVPDTEGEQVIGYPIGALLRTVDGAFEDALREGAILDGRFVQKIYDTTDSAGSVGTTADFNESGNVAIKVGIRPGPSPTPVPNEAIYAGDPSSPKLIAEQHSPAPGLSLSMLDNLSPRPSIAANGFVAFSASLVGSGPTSAIFAGEPDAMEPKALEGDLVPTTTDIHFDTLSDAVVNSTGDVIFRAGIRYPNESKREGIWIQRRTGPPVLLAISGMTLPTPGGDREVDSVDFAGPGTFNDLHQFVFLAKFENGDHGVYEADTRPGAPVVFVTTPRKPRDFLATEDSVKVFGIATDDTGVDKVEYTVAREVLATKKGGKHPKKKKPKKFVISRAKLAKGDVNWSFEVPLSLGLNLISIVATDKLGNQSEPYKIRMLRYDPDEL